MKIAQTTMNANLFCFHKWVVLGKDEQLTFFQSIHFLLALKINLFYSLNFRVPQVLFLLASADIGLGTL